MSYFKEDFNRYLVLSEDDSIYNSCYIFCFTPALWILASYRFGRWVRKECRIPIIKPLLKTYSLVQHFFLSLLTGIDIPFQVNIGKGFHISHYGGIIINASTNIGEYCNIGPGVVIGQGGRKGNKGVPKIGNYVYMGSGAKIVGKITIGDHVAIGANAVVIRDIPNNMTAAGIPAKIINNLGSYDFITLQKDKL